MIRLFRHFYMPLFIFATLISVMGLLNLYSATQDISSSAASSYFKAQLLYTLIGMVVMVVVSRFSLKALQSMAPVVYIVSLVLLGLVLVMGQTVHGAMSWLSVGGFRLQPSEFGKLGLIFMMSHWLSGLQLDRSLKIKELIWPAILFVIPTTLVILQNDLGSSLFYGFLFGSLLLIQGVRWKLLLIALGICVVTAVVSYHFFLKPYQKDRIVSFLHPERDPRGSGYHLVQSKIAVGSGGLLGKGYLKGESHRLKFLPERHTDFIFPVLAEEWGFVGAVSTLLLYFLLLMSGISVAQRAQNRFGFFVSLGVVALFFWHLVINLGGVLGMLPLTGVPLPLLSYGGSSLLVVWIGLGVLMAVMRSRLEVH